jgi:hypothetical protein
MDGGPFRQMQDNGQTDGRAGIIYSMYIQTKDKRQTYCRPGIADRQKQKTDRRMGGRDNRHTDAGQQTDVS